MKLKLIFPFYKAETLSLRDAQNDLLEKVVAVIWTQICLTLSS